MSWIALPSRRPDGNRFSRGRLHIDANAGSRARFLASPGTLRGSGRALVASCAFIGCGILILAGCAAPPIQANDSSATLQSDASVAATPPTPSAELEERILALDPQHITEHDVRTTLALGPTPRIILLHGGVYGTELLMMSFGKFLIGMGYPETKIRDPSDGAYSRNPYGSSERLAGEIAWDYEHDGVRPMIVGHSQGGVQAVKVLYELSGAFTDRLAVWNPQTGSEEQRYAIVDPLTGAKRTVVGASLAYVAVVGAGGVALAAPVHWVMAKRLHKIPDTVEEFTGFSIDFDLIALTFPGSEKSDLYHANGAAEVHNVNLPGTYNHIFVPVVQGLAADPQMRAWLNAFVPGADNGEPPGNNALFAGEVWFNIKKHWCIEAQRFIRAFARQ